MQLQRVTFSNDVKFIKLKIISLGIQTTILDNKSQGTIQGNNGAIQEILFSIEIKKILFQTIQTRPNSVQECYN